MIKNYSHIFRSVFLSPSVSSLCLLPVLSCVESKLCIVGMLECAGVCVCVCVCVHLCACSDILFHTTGFGRSLNSAVRNEHVMSTRVCVFVSH